MFLFLPTTETATRISSVRRNDGRFSFVDWMELESAFLFVCCSVYCAAFPEVRIPFITVCSMQLYPNCTGTQHINTHSTHSFSIMI